MRYNSNMAIICMKKITEMTVLNVIVNVLDGVGLEDCVGVDWIIEYQKGNREHEYQLLFD